MSPSPTQSGRLGRAGVPAHMPGGFLNLLVTVRLHFLLACLGHWTSSVKANLCSPCIFGCLCSGHQSWVGADGGVRGRRGVFRIFRLECVFQDPEPKPLPYTCSRAVTWAACDTGAQPRCTEVLSPVPCNQGLAFPWAHQQTRAGRNSELNGAP